MLTGTERKWNARIAEWRASGLSACKFVVGKGYSESSLRNHATRQRQRSIVAQHSAQAPVAEGAPAEQPSPTIPLPTAKFVALVPVASQSKSQMAIHVAGVVVNVEPGFDPSLLLAVVTALKGAK